MWAVGWFYRLCKSMQKPHGSRITTDAANMFCKTFITRAEYMNCYGSTRQAGYKGRDKRTYGCRGTEGRVQEIRTINLQEVGFKIDL